MATLEDLLKMADEAHQETIELTQALVRIPSVNTGRNNEPPWPPSGKPGPGEDFAEPEVAYDKSGSEPTGDELPAAELIRDKLAADGIEATVYKSQENRANVVARLSGQTGNARLLMMSHIDVVPVEDVSQWTHDPFGGEIDEGRLYGRGSSDMKSTVAAETMAMIILKRAGVKLKGDLKLAVCADEESGGAYGFGWMAQHYPETLEAEFAVNEGGGSPIKEGDRLIYPINTGEKGRLEVRIHITGRGFHASQPWRADNAIYKAEEVIRRIRTYQPEVSVDHDLFNHLDKLAGIKDKPTAQNIDEIIEQLTPTKENLASYLKACSRMTFVASMIQAGVKSNSVAESCVITCDVRSLPHQTTDYVQKEVEKLMEGLAGVRVETIETSPPSASTFDSELVDHVAKATNIAVGRDDVEYVPGLTVGFTDSSFVRPLGNVAYGFMPAHPEADTSKNGAHNINESMDVQSINTFTRYLVALAWETVVDHG
jgi:acetylornithine deacetylase/succinyl-diaminopimelate desuccinylase-like protein